MPYPDRPRFLLLPLALSSEFAVKFEPKLSAAKFTHEFGVDKFALKLGAVKFTARSAPELALEIISGLVLAAKFAFAFEFKFAFGLEAEFASRLESKFAFEFTSEPAFTPKLTFRLVGCPLLKFALALRMFLKFTSAPRAPFKILSSSAALKFEFKFAEQAAAL